jgi:predicted SAM-dependent methyltransferase
LSISDANIKHIDIDIKKVLIDRDLGFRLPQKDDSLDMILAFYTLEHLYPLRDYLKEFHRILKPDGLLVGAIPSEGSIQWGLGRYQTPRRSFKKDSNLDPDKLICCEHPNFSDDVMDELHTLFKVRKKQYYPLPLPSYDFNLTINFVAHKN